jgi:hypothetical protein
MTSMSALANSSGEQAVHGWWWWEAEPKGGAFQLAGCPSTALSPHTVLLLDDEQRPARRTAAPPLPPSIISTPLNEMRFCSFSSLLVVVSTAAAAVAVIVSRSCQTQSQPNPIVNEYPGQVTGTINGTTAIVPIPYDVARSMIPAEYGILRQAYEVS